MSRFLSHIEMQSPDCTHRIGQALLLPLSTLFGRAYRIEKGVHELPADSLLKRTLVAAFAILLLPITLVAAALGALLLNYSVTHQKAFNQIEGSQISITWHGHRPEIQTKRLLIRPIQSADLPAYQKLFASAITMQHYRGGPVANISGRFNGWLERWKFHPFSALAVVDRETNQVIGHTAVGHGDYGGPTQGWSEMAVIMDPGYWNASFATQGGVQGSQGRTGIGTEVVRATVIYARALKERNYLVPVDVEEKQRAAISGTTVHLNNKSEIDWAYVPFTELRATVSRQNPGANAMAQTLAEEFGAVRTTFTEDTSRDLLTLSLN